MAKKTVLKRVLKYAPLKSDFVLGLAQDGVIKTELSDDMYSVPSVAVEDYETVEDDAVLSADPAAGEVIGELLQRPVCYVADFLYIQDGQIIVEDCKRMSTPEYIIKRKLMLHICGIRILEA